MRACGGNAGWPDQGSRPVMSLAGAPENNTVMVLDADLLCAFLFCGHETTAGTRLRGATMQGVFVDRGRCGAPWTRVVFLGGWACLTCEGIIYYPSHEHQNTNSRQN